MTQPRLALVRRAAAFRTQSQADKLVGLGCSTRALARETASLRVPPQAFLGRDAPV